MKSSLSLTMSLKLTMALLTISFSLLLIFFPVLSLSQEFVFNGFYDTRTDSELKLEGASIIKAYGALRLTNTSHYVIGHAFYPQPIQMLVNGSSNSSSQVASFSTYFAFAIITPTSGQGGFGLAFTVAPSTNFPGAEPEHYLGIFNSSHDGDPKNHVFAVEFDTVNNNRNDDSDTQGNHVGININSMNSKFVEPAAYWVNTKEDFSLESGDSIQAWIEYDGVSNVVNVTICPISREKPSRPLISYPLNEGKSVFTDTMYVGFSASTGTKVSSHYILGWSFSMNGAAPPLNLSQLPRPHVEKSSSNSLKLPIKILIAVLSAVVVLLLGLLGSFKLFRRIRQFEILEDWELDCPHRFRYGDLYKATKGFKESEMIGVGGFGAVYKGVLPTTGSEIAVKKISRNSIQGMREFAAEIESLGRLRHKHLVNLLGWCKRKNDLLLVYDYIPNGSLDSLLFCPTEDFVLSWEQRFNIIKGIAAGLLYLHEEWEQVVIHRDVKSSNVLIDADMNARLGDFGLARLYDHGKVSHTTSVVGTIGYIPIELARTGKASTRTDVFAYGVLVLEVATGRRPVDSDHFILVDWILEFQQLGQILDVVDPKLGSSYIVEEMEMVLGLGLLCCHQIPEARPTMRQVLRYLNGDDLLPIINWSSFNSPLSRMNSRVFEIISADTIAGSHLSSSIGCISSGSIEAGR